MSTSAFLDHCASLLFSREVLWIQLSINNPSGSGYSGLWSGTLATICCAREGSLTSSPENGLICLVENPERVAGMACKPMIEHVRMTDKVLSILLLLFFMQV